MYRKQQQQHEQKEKKRTNVLKSGWRVVFAGLLFRFQDVAGGQPGVASGHRHGVHRGAPQRRRGFRSPVARNRPGAALPLGERLHAARVSLHHSEMN